MDAELDSNYTVRVTNVGKVAGDEVVMGFLSRPRPVPADIHTASSPIKELFGFQRVFLQPGASVLVTLPMPAAQLRQATEAAAILLRGEYLVQVYSSHHLFIELTYSDNL